MAQKINNTSFTGLALIKRFEGFSSSAYLCPGGYQTIGFGHLIKPYESFSGEITQQQAEKLLRQDIAFAELAIGRLIHVPINQNQFDALVSFTFNLGASALQRSTLRRKINKYEHEDVPEELLKWTRAGGKRLQGLITRRYAEANLYMSALE